MNKQRGFGIAGMIATLIVLSALSYVVMYWGKVSEEGRIAERTKPFFEHLLNIKHQVNMYQVDKIAEGWPPSSATVLPSRWEDLQPSYLPACTAIDNNAGNCAKPAQTPWGSLMQFSRVSYSVGGISRYRVQINIPLPALTDATRFEHAVYVSVLSGLPGVQYSAGSNRVIWNIDRIDSGVQQDALVKRSGDDSTLTGDWDVGGNYAITNVRDVTIRNADGTQRSLAAGLPIVIYHHGERINKHKCPSNFTAEAITSIKGIYNLSNPNLFENISSSRSYVVDRGSYWLAGLDYYASIGGEQTLLHDGEITVQLICKRN